MPDVPESCMITSMNKLGDVSEDLEILFLIERTNPKR